MSRPCSLTIGLMGSRLTPGHPVLHACKQINAVADDLFFLGSRLGDSLLIQLHDPRSAAGAADVRGTPLLLLPPPSAAAVAAAAAVAGAAAALAGTTEADATAKASLAGPDGELDELDQLLLGSANDELRRPAAAGTLQITYTVCDSLLNVGPIADLTLGQPVVALSVRARRRIHCRALCGLSGRDPHEDS